MVGIDVRCPWTGAKAVKWNKRKAVSPLLTQGCTLQELYLPALSIVHLVESHRPVNIEKNQPVSL